MSAADRALELYWRAVAEGMLSIIDSDSDLDDATDRVVGKILLDLGEAGDDDSDEVRSELYEHVWGGLQ